ncbi:MAG: N-formylglutamate amidohydrolase [Rhizobiales bacterium]|nr:N-formylglutamate amidohydrolase [Hyphomicrobiales bacterium]MBO6700182.1 N-formylglutamate amidohydrolase [Hyphomicrobiales bacterium]MBO6737653.1 N-formylglutamate amidohydrolase [Hyphomicrobiales bacterium]MBO6913290.1 N-formylglutamate amidohydrolase [Hyphomicrobiales bacterium]MBO6956868.1 N-formylglutamate amidohydrolase [Hyphomicrobiales bacterium]
MDTVESFDSAPPYDLLVPITQTVPFVFGSPHSGTSYPRAFLEASQLSTLDLRRSEDTYVDRLITPAVQKGAPMIAARFPRCYCDVNREPYELDPRMFSDAVPAFANTASLRVAGGLGTVPRVVGDRQPIYRRKLPIADAMERVEKLYKPYHSAVRRALAQTHVRFGASALIDCHSMPSIIRTASGTLSTDFVVGDRFGASCAPEISETIVETLRDLGFTVARNKPYAGGFITEHYGRPDKGIHAVQLEINRGLYMNERTLVPNAGFNAVMDALSEMMDALFMLDVVRFAPIDRAAAE